MIGKGGKVLKKQKDGHFLVQVHGETWQAESKEDLIADESVIVTQMEDLILQIRKHLSELILMFP
jgi:membrane protein implicated in regulation of membrane protease activity